MKSKVYKRLTSWIAMCAILMVSFAPIVSHAKSLNGLEESQKICTSQGIKDIPSSPSYPSDQHSAMHMQHCAYCSFSSDKAYLPSDTVQIGSVVIPSYSQFFTEYEAPVLQAHFQSSHPPQAPPAI